VDGLLCPHCRHLNDSLEQLQAAVPPGGWRWSPAIPARRKLQSRRAAEGRWAALHRALALICLEQAPDFWSLRDKVFAAQKNLSRDSLLQIASSGSVSRGQLEGCIASPEAAAKLQDDIRYAGLTTPPARPSSSSTASGLPCAGVPLRAHHGQR
jgi:serine/threonine-protein kinase